MTETSRIEDACPDCGHPRTAGHTCKNGGNLMTHFPNQPGPKDTRTGESTSIRDAHDLLTPQRCENGVHADWAVDSEEDHACPWCEANRLRARVAAQEAALHDALVAAGVDNWEGYDDACAGL